MYELDFNTPAKIHFTGIGGISMSGLAEIMLSKGFTVTGSDSRESEITKHLESLGATIYYGQKASNVAADTEVLIYTAAVKADNPELVAATEMNIPLLTRAEFLGQIMKNYHTAIGVSGTHGKTTTTSMLSQIMLEANTDPTILVGGIMPAINGNTRIGHSDNMITEACEYTNSFLSFAPTIGIILNVATLISSRTLMTLDIVLEDMQNLFLKTVHLLLIAILITLTILLKGLSATLLL